MATILYSSAHIQKPVSKTMLIYKKAARLRRTKRKNTEYILSTLQPTYNSPEPSLIIKPTPLEPIFLVDIVNIRARIIFVKKR